MLRTVLFRSISYGVESDWGLTVKHSELDSFLKILPQTAEG